MAEDDHVTQADQMAAGSHVGCIAVAPSRDEYLDRLAAWIRRRIGHLHRRGAPGICPVIIPAAKPASREAGGRPGWAQATRPSDPSMKEIKEMNEMKEETE